MTQVVVTSPNNTVLTNKVSNTVITATEKIGTTIVTGLLGPPGKNELSAMNDVDISSLVTGSILVYNQTNQKWVSTTTLEDQYLNGGNF